MQRATRLHHFQEPPDCPVGPDSTAPPLRRAPVYCHDVRGVSPFSTRLRFCLARGITVITALERKPPCGSVANIGESDFDRASALGRWSGAS
jgi:hypothetical protein